MWAQPLLLFCSTRKNDLEGICVCVLWRGIVFWTERKALATAQLHCPDTQESPLMSLEWFSFIAYCLSLQIAFRMNVPARIHIEDTGFPSTFLHTDALSLYETYFKLTINRGCILHLMKRKLYHIRSSALWLRQWIRWGLRAGVLSYWA